MGLLLVSWILLLSLPSLFFDINNNHVYAKCQLDQSSLLLQFKQGLSFSAFASSDTSRLTSWNASTDCCSWNGVTCDKTSGLVIALDLTGESISGGFDNSSSLFELIHLESLNLALNNFDSTPIPSGLARLTKLTNLNLSESGLAGQIPNEISHMRRLISLDLSSSYPNEMVSIYRSRNYLKLENPDLKELVQDMSELRILVLDCVNISTKGSDWCQAVSFALPKVQVLRLAYCWLRGPFNSSLLKLQFLSELRLSGNNFSAKIPEFFGRFAKLAVLELKDCGLYGTFPGNIFQLQLLRSIDVSSNPLLHGFLPEFPPNESLQTLILSGSSFSGRLPNSIGNLKFLSKLDFSSCSFNGAIPLSVSNLTQLQYLDLSSNAFTGPIPYYGLSENITHINLADNQLTGPISSSHWDRFPKLVYLYLSNNSLNGTIPSVLFTLPLLQRLFLSQNQFTGQLSEFSNGSNSKLRMLEFNSNMLAGPIPSTIFDVSSLVLFRLSSNEFSGNVSLDMFQKLKNLSILELSGNKLSVNMSSRTSFPQVTTLMLGSCNLKAFPGFLRNQLQLVEIDLSNNQILGKIPNYIWNMSTLVYVNLSHNFLEEVELPLADITATNMSLIDLHSNLLQGPISGLPLSALFMDYSSNNFTSIIPSNIGSYLTFTIFFSLSSNSLTGEIPASICDAGLLEVLNLSNNSLSGTIPICLGSMRNLEVLNLWGNSFHGTIPNTFLGLCSLRTLDLHGNKIEGEMPKTLANCTTLQVIDLGNNKMTGIFPSWLSNLLQLRVLILKSNRFHGCIGHPEMNSSFPMLQIIDLSSNNFTGNIPSEYFLRWKAMMIDEEALKKYKDQILKYEIDVLGGMYYQDDVTVTIKGLEMELVKILTVFTCIDLSNNKFKGEIPHEIGDLTSLHILNLSRNALTGPIPSSLGSLKQLESLDLSQNKLSGEIPPQLADVTFLSVLNLSFNQLVGKIPRGPQMQTFNEDSFKGNDQLCGPPLPKNCSVTPSPTSEEASSNGFCKESLFKNCPDDGEPNWQLILTALGFGVGNGLAVCIVVFWGPLKRLYQRFRRHFQVNP